MNQSIIKLRNAIITLLLVILFGIAGYIHVEGMDPFDALYMTIISITTVGFMEVKELSRNGRIITMLIIISGITVGAYAIGNLFGFIVEGELKKTLGRRKLEKKIRHLKDHYIICGYGRIGYMICAELHRHGKAFVVIENDPKAVTALEESGFLYIPMDATNDDALTRANIAHARALVTAVKSDADNVFITLTAKGINPSLYILARTSDSNNDAKLRRAGANQVVSPYQIGGLRMAQVLLRPTVVDFIDSAVMESKFGLGMEEALIRKGSSFSGKNLLESNIRKDYGVIIVLVKKHDGEMIFGPTPQVLLEEGDTLVMLGKTEMLEKLEAAI